MRPQSVQLLRSFSVLIALALCAGCASLPDVTHVLDDRGHQRTWPMHDGKGALSHQERRRANAALAAQTPYDEAQRAMLATIQAAVNEPLTIGNSARLLHDGEQTFRAMFSAIRAARSHINMEYYIFEDVRSDDESLSELLLHKLASGVAVNIVYDSVGSLATDAALFTKLEHAGAALVEFNPINPLEAHGEYSLNNRDHRKILIVDGSVAIVGGINISSTYESGGSAFSSGPDGQSTLRWRDTDVELRGPVVERLQLLFMQVWGEQSQQEMALKVYFPTPETVGDQAILVMGSAPDQGVAKFYAAMLASLRHAQQRIWITNAYFVPTPAHVTELVAAAQRGVDVRLLLPATTDSNAALAVAHSHYEYLVAAGVKIFEVHQRFLHAKTALVDSAWSMLGSSNFDHRSALFNHEVDVVIINHEFASALEQQFLVDCADAALVDRARIKKLPLLERIKGRLIRLWPHLL